MDKKSVNSVSEVFFSCVEKKYYSKKMLISQHAIIRIISGGTRIVQADQVHEFRGGDTIFVPRNQLAKVTKYPENGQPYRAVSIFFSQESLRQFYVSQEVNLVNGDRKQIKSFGQHALLESLFGSLLPYFDLEGGLPPEIAAGKVKEAISILRTIDKSIDAALRHFEEPGKIDLEEFMEKNFMFNMPAEKFGYLTGRSLTTFKKDFKKIFHTTPQRWLTKKRLELAHFQLFEKERKPSDVYFEVGFENLSHFSFAFKKQYGYNPKAIKNLSP